jgi:hypothetical protein
MGLKCLSPGREMLSPIESSEATIAMHPTIRKTKIAPTATRMNISARECFLVSSLRGSGTCVIFAIDAPPAQEGYTLPRNHPEFRRSV